MRTIGFLLPGRSRTTVVRAQLEVFRQGLKEYGWIEGQNISIEYRFAEGKEDALAEIAAELRLDVIVAEGMAAIRAAPGYGATTILAHFFGYHESFVQGNGVPGGGYEVFGVRR